MEESEKLEALASQNDEIASSRATLECSRRAIDPFKFDALARIILNIIKKIQNALDLLKFKDIIEDIELHDGNKIKGIADYAKFKRSDFKVTFFTTKYLLFRSELEEQCYRVLSGLKNGNDFPTDMKLESVVNELNKIVNINLNSESAPMGSVKVQT